MMMKQYYKMEQDLFGEIEKEKSSASASMIFSLGFCRQAALL